MEDVNINLVLEKSKYQFSVTKIKSGIMFLLILGLLGLIYYPIFIWIWQRWFAADSYYTHGPLIPIVSIVLVWLKRKNFSKVQIQSSNLGLWLIIAGILIHIVSAFARIYFTSAYSFLIIILGLILFFFGKKVTRIVIFPLAFLLFMIPFPVSVIEATTLKMKLFVAQMSVGIIQLFDISAVREGSMVYMQNTSVIVGDPCSGLRSIISLSALSILFAYIVHASYTKKAILFISSIPIAIIANVIRTTLTLLIANFYGNEIITNKYLHNGFGLMVFIIAFLGLFFIGKILKCKIIQRDLS